MNTSYQFLLNILNAITEHIVVIDESGVIQFANKRWSDFGNDNACLVGDDWVGINYLAECIKAAEAGDKFGAKAAEGIQCLLARKEALFYFEYPCHSPEEQRWFMMHITPFDMQEKRFLVISHQNITERKLAEEKVKSLARMDGLTKIPNRRTFDTFLHDEWNRCVRLSKPISLAMVDLDHFKLLNDTYGHQTGDECLVKVADLLKTVTLRPSDLCARYGGEEFALVWGDTSLAQAQQLCTKLLNAIRDLRIANKNSPTHPYMTTSIGLVSLIPERGEDEGTLITKADKLLYQAKTLGRNRIEV